MLETWQGGLQQLTPIIVPIFWTYFCLLSGVGLATKSSSRQLKKECASILENIKVSFINDRSHFNRQVKILIYKNVKVYALTLLCIESVIYKIYKNLINVVNCWAFMRGIFSP